MCTQTSLQWSVTSLRVHVYANQEVHFMNKSAAFIRFFRRPQSSLTVQAEMLTFLRILLSFYTMISPCLTSLLDYKPLQGRIQFWFTPGFLPKHLAQKKPLINIYWRKEGLTEGKQGGKSQKLLDLSLSSLTRLHQNASNWCLCRCQIVNHFRKITFLMWFQGYSLRPWSDSICILSLSLIWRVTI